MNVQAEVEQHDVYLLTMVTSSIEDQASLVSDRIVFKTFPFPSLLVVKHK